MLAGTARITISLVPRSLKCLVFTSKTDVWPFFEPFNLAVFNICWIVVNHSFDELLMVFKHSVDDFSGSFSVFVACVHFPSNVRMICCRSLTLKKSNGRQPKVVAGIDLEDLSRFEDMIQHRFLSG